MKLNDKQKVIALALFFLVLVGGVFTLNFLKFQERGERVKQIEKFQREERAAHTLMLIESRAT